MNPPKIGISGIRGVPGESFSPELAINLAAAFATITEPGRVYVCEDARPSGIMVRSAVLSALLAAGMKPVDLDICPVPAMCAAITDTGAVGGIVVSAGHTPERWNAIRFINSRGIYFNSLETDELLDVYHQGEFVKAQWDEIKSVEFDPGARKRHIKKILDSVDVKKIRSMKYKIAVDACNGACSGPAARILDALGCKTIFLNRDPGKPFPHNPEPNKENMSQLAGVVKGTDFDMGFFFDTAGERLSIVMDGGVPLSEELTFPLCLKMLPARAMRGAIVTNISTSGMAEALTAKSKCEVIRTPVGQAYVQEAAEKHGAIIAGEGSGGVALSHIHYAFDSLAAMAFILDGMARGNKKSLSRTVASLPLLHMVKRKIKSDFSDLYRMMRRARSAIMDDAMGAKVNHSDGIRLDWPDGWLHIRISATRPLIRIIAESANPARAEELAALGERIARS